MTRMSSSVFDFGNVTNDLHKKLMSMRKTFRNPPRKKIWITLIKSDCVNNQLAIAIGKQVIQIKPSEVTIFESNTKKGIGILIQDRYELSLEKTTARLSRTDNISNSVILKNIKYPLLVRITGTESVMRYLHIQ